MMKKITCLICLLLFICQQTFSQSEFKPGHIIKNNGDTISGFIKSTNLKRIGKFCHFKKEMKSKAEKFTPEQINAFHFYHGKHFVSKPIMENNKETKVFLEYLVNGEANLYYRKDKTGNHYYIQNKTDSLVELSNSKFKKEINGRQYTIEKQEYKLTLSYLFKNTPKIQQDINDLKFSYNDFIDITKKYHDYVCDDYECIVYEKNVEPSLSVGISAGIYNSTISFHNIDQYQFIENENLSQSETFYTGIHIKRKNIFGMSNKLDFNVEIGYYKQKWDSKRCFIEIGSISIPVSLSYSFLDTKISPFVNFGARNSFFIYKDISHIDVYFGESLRKTIGKYQLSGLLGFGFKYKRNKVAFLLSANYEMGSGIISNSYINDYLTSKTENIAINFGVLFDLKKN